MKNSEWGAVAYLAHSKYGRNGIEVSVNTNNYNGTDCTGGGQGTAYIENADQSTTGNVYGIYDMSGNAYEWTAAFNSAYTGHHFTSEFYLSAKGTHFASTGGVSTEYATAYNNSTSTDGSNFTVGDVSHTGDGIHETFVKTTKSWFEDTCSFVNIDDAFFIRGGYCIDESSAGVFFSFKYPGNSFSSNSFRVVCAF